MRAGRADGIEGVTRERLDIVRLQMRRIRNGAIATGS